MLEQIKKISKYLILLLVLPALLFALYTWASLTWTYSSASGRAMVQKTLAKRLVCKTYEGELILVSMPGTQAEKFFFTVRNKVLLKNK